MTYGGNQVLLCLLHINCNNMAGLSSTNSPPHCKVAQTAVLQAQHLCLNRVLLFAIAEYAKCDISEKGIVSGNVMSRHFLRVKAERPISAVVTPFPD